MAYTNKPAFTGRFEPGHFLLEHTGCQSHTIPDVVSLYVWGYVYDAALSHSQGASDVAAAMVELFMDKGLEALKRVEGNFTCLIETQGVLYLLRDAYGAGPQIYYTTTHFSSSLWQLSRLPDVMAEPDRSTLATFLTRGYIATPHTAIKGVSKLGAGCSLEFRDGHIRIMGPVEAKMRVGTTASEKEIKEQYEHLHTDAIRRRIEGRGSVGILLSGGYDSGCNLLALRRQYTGDIHSFSIGFKGDNWSELPLAQCMSDTFSTIHHTYEIDGSEIEHLPHIIRELGDPFVEGGLMVNYAVLKMAAQHPQDVLLGGDGNDQLFGTTGREIALSLLMRRCGAYPFVSLLNRVLDSERFDQNNTFYKVKFHTDKLLNLLEGDLFGFPDFRVKELLQDPFWYQKEQKIKLDSRSFETAFLQHAELADLRKTIEQVILFKASKLADLFGQHLTYPYLDGSIKAFLDSVPLSYRWKGEGLLSLARGQGESKSLLKRCYKPHLPEAITNRKKQGGFAPMPLFFSDAGRFEQVRSTILESSICKDFLYRPNVESFLNHYALEASIQGGWFWYRQNKAIQLFNLYALAIWWNEFMDHSKG